MLGLFSAVVAAVLLAALPSTAHAPTLNHEKRLCSKARVCQTCRGLPGCYWCKPRLFGQEHIGLCLELAEGSGIEEYTECTYYNGVPVIRKCLSELPCYSTKCKSCLQLSVNASEIDGYEADLPALVDPRTEVDTLPRNTSCMWCSFPAPPLGVCGIGASFTKECIEAKGKLQLNSMMGNRDTCVWNRGHEKRRGAAAAAAAFFIWTALLMS